MRERTSPSRRDRRWTLLSRLLPLVAIGFVSVFALAGLLTAGTIRGSAAADVLRGTAATDVLAGLGGDDRLFGYKGADRIHGDAGNDLVYGGADDDRLFGDAGNDLVNGGTGDDRLVAGKGRDRLSGGPGDDELFAQDGARDVLRCGGGRDIVHPDPVDAVGFDCERGRIERPPIGPPPPPPSSGQTVVLDDRPWVCSGRVDLDLVKVTLRTGNRDAVYLRTNCSGRIGRLEIETWAGDGVKVNAPEPVARDLTIYGGYIRCFDHAPGAHQDGIQVMGGERITFRELEIQCNSNPNGQLFISGANGGVPTDVVCERCVLGGGAASTLFLGESVRSGARRSLICAGRFHNVRIEGSAESPVNTGNSLIEASDRRCRAAG